MSQAAGQGHLAIKEAAYPLESSHDTRLPGLARERTVVIPFWQNEHRRFGLANGGRMGLQIGHPQTHGSSHRGMLHSMLWRSAAPACSTYIIP